MRFLFLFIGIVAMALEIKSVSFESYAPLYHLTHPIKTATPLYATAQPWSQDSLDFAKNFEIAEIGGFEDIKALNLQGFHKKIAYVWLAGFYKDEIEYNPFARWAYLNKEKATLNPHYTPNGNDFYYDLCNDEVRQKRVGYLLEQIRLFKLDGLFFDWANEEFLKEPKFTLLQKHLHQRHPHTAYSDCIAKFFEALKKRGILIVTNQAYRNPKLLRFVDYDATESYITTTKELPKEAIIDNRLQPISVSEFVPIDEVLFYFQKLSKLKKRYRSFGFRNFIYLNYCAPKLVPSPKGYQTIQPKEALFYAYALAKMGGFIPFVEVPYNHALERTNLYFSDIGKAIEPIQRVGEFLFRRFTQGFILVAPKLSQTSYYRLMGVPRGFYYDLYEGVWLKSDGSLTIKLTPYYDPFTKSFQPIAKVFFYEDTLPH